MSPYLKFKKVALIEADPDMMQLLCDFLNLQNLHLECFNSFQNFLDEPLSLLSPLDLIVLDVQSRSRHSLVAVKAIRKQFPHAAMVMLTSEPTMILKTSVPPEGVDLMIQKPFLLEDLLVGLTRLSQRPGMINSAG